MKIVSYAVALLGSTFFFPLVLGLGSRRISREAATASSVAGTLACAAWIAATLAGASWAQPIHPGVIGLAVSGALILGISAVTHPVEGDAIRRFFPEAA